MFIGTHIYVALVQKLCAYTFAPLCEVTTRLQQVHPVSTHRVIDSCVMPKTLLKTQESCFCVVGMHVKCAHHICACA